MHTEIVLLANAYIEICCWDMIEIPLRRRWGIRRTVDYSRICLQ